jgi:predicted alternative tryptophan synthase beta-subunit
MKRPAGQWGNALIMAALIRIARKKAYMVESQIRLGVNESRQWQMVYTSARYVVAWREKDEQEAETKAAEG